MEKTEIISRLKNLSDILSQLELSEKEMLSTQKALSDAENKELTAVEEYDEKHKSSYITERIGEEPQKPSRKLILAVPVYMKKKKEYEEKLSSYRKAYSIVEEEYYKKHKEIREELDKKDRQNKDELIQKAKESANKSADEYSRIKATVDSEEIISQNLKETTNVNMLISFFEEGRCDTMKEAINLLFEEKHRHRIELLCQQQLELTEQIAIIAKNADEKAEEALEIANEAKELAEEAYSLAEEANSNSDETDSY